MSNRIDKPMLSFAQLVAKMRDEKGITFKYTSEDTAEAYLSDVNNYMRTAAYWQNYQKYPLGANAGKFAGGGTGGTTTNNNQKTTNLGGVNIYVTGSNNQSADDLAKTVADKINDMLDEDNSVFK